MSHIVTIEVEIRDAAAVRAACSRLRLPEPVHGRHQLFSSEVDGLAVELPDWRYPVVCNLSSGQAQYDNYEGRWGNQDRLDELVQSYSIEKCRIEARKRGHTLTEHALPDGSVKLVVGMEGGAA